jgi:hypothetical protein
MSRNNIEYGIYVNGEWLLRAIKWGLIVGLVSIGGCGQWVSHQVGKGLWAVGQKETACMFYSSEYEQKVDDCVNWTEIGWERSVYLTKTYGIVEGSEPMDPGPPPSDAAYPLQKKPVVDYKVTWN